MDRDCQLQRNSWAYQRGEITLAEFEQRRAAILGLPDSVAERHVKQPLDSDVDIRLD